MTNTVEGKSVVVTGAARGMGRAIAIRVATGGARVVVSRAGGVVTAVAQRIDALVVPGLPRAGGPVVHRADRQIALGQGVSW